MSMKDDFLEEIKQGDYVTISYGQNLTVEGTVIKLTDSQVRLQTKSGSPRIALDSIISYDTPEPPEETKEEEQREDIGGGKGEDEGKSQTPAPVPVFTGVQALAELLTKAAPMTLEEIADWEGAKSRFEGADCPRALRNEGMSLISTFINVRKQMPMAANLLEDKMHNITAKAHRLALQYPEVKEDLYDLLASMYFQLEDYARAESFCVRAGDHMGAAYAAHLGRNTKELDRYLDEYVRYPSEVDPYLYALYAASACRRRSVLALCQRGGELLQIAEPEEQDRHELECLCAAALAISRDGSLPLEWAMLYSPDEAGKCLERFGASLPEGWEKADIPAGGAGHVGGGKKPEVKVYTSTIIRFDPEKLCGFINGTPDNHFFHLRQVTKEDDLRRILAHGEPASNLEVTFSLGKPYDPTKRPSAYNVRLTERGAAEAERRLEHIRQENTAGEEVVYGTMDDYSQEMAFGHIFADGKTYNVIGREIVDPHLKAYLALNYRCDVRVCFFAKTDKKGKNIAVKVRLANEADQASESDLRSLIRQKELTQAEVDAWPKVKARLENPEAFAPQVRDLYELPYEELEPVPEKPAEKPKTESEPPAPNPGGTTQQTVTTVTSSNLPPLEPLPRNGSNPFAGLAPLSGVFYEEAHRKMLRGDLKEAEQLYISAIRAKDRTESAIADLVTVYLRDASRINDAISLMESYGGELPEEKRMNMVIQIYQKGQDRPYRIKLCYLLDEAVAMPIPIKTRLHYLGLQGSTLRSLGEYNMALNSYRRWRQMYDTEVQYRGQSAVTQFANALNFIKRGEATCYYLLGEKAKAEELAKELIRVSAADEIAQRILDGTLQDMPGLESGKGADEQAFVVVSEEEINLDGVELSGFARNRMNEIPLSRYLKSYALVNEGYMGDARKAHDDIGFLLGAQGQTPSVRSERLLCAAKIVLSVQERFGKEKGMQASLRKLRLTEADEKTYIARSMASYGDAVLEAQQEQDTARYAYLQAIELLTERETDWNKSFNHYILSYFHGRQDIAQIVIENNRSRAAAQPKGADTSVLVDGRPQDVGEFVIGMVKLRKTLRLTKRNLRTHTELVDRLRRCAAIDDVVSWLERNEIQVNHSTIDGFAKTLNQAEEMMQRAEQEVGELMKRLPSQVLSMINSEELLEQLRSPRLCCWLNYADRNRLNQICAILDEFRSYFTIRDFQHRSVRFERAIQQTVDLVRTITDNPTQLSYDVFLPQLEQTRLRLQEERDRHYASLPPEIELRFTEGVSPYLNNSEIHVHLTIANGSAQSGGAERQLADNIELTAAAVTPGVEFLRIDTDTSGCVYGGKELEAILVFRVTDEQVLTLGTFDASVKCTYRYNALPTKVEDGEVTFDEPVVFHWGQVSRIENPFHKYIGHEMEDAEMFKGRQATIDQLVSTMRVDGRFNYGHGILLYGQTRAGKSSIRVHFVNAVRRTYPGVILVDMKNLNGEAITEQSFYIDLLNVLEVELKKNHPDVLAKMEEEELVSPRERFETQPAVAMSYFRRFMSGLYELIKPMGKMILLVADEFSAINTAIKDGRLHTNFMQSWKAMLENYGLFTVCFGQDDTPIFVRANQNAFARMELQKITYLAEDPAKDLMDSPIAVKHQDDTLKSRYTAAALDELYELTSGSAYLIIKVCDLLVEYLNSKGAENVTPGILQNFLRTSVFKGNSCITEQDFEPQIGDRADANLYEVNRSLLLDIARNSQTNGWAEIHSLSAEGLEPREGQTPQRRLDELLQRLQERDVIEMEERRRCRIKVALLTRWLLTTYGRR